MSEADFLVELGTEELPPKALLRLRDAFADALLGAIDQAGLAHGAAERFATPRRLAVLVPALATAQPARRKELRGPPMRLAFDEDGQPTKAAEAFAAKCGVAVGELGTTSSDKGEWLYYEGTEEGARTEDLLGGFVEDALAKLPIPKRMRWGDRDTEFVRPVHWLVMLLGKDVVRAEVLGLSAGRDTFGHRFHAPEAISLAAAGEYAARLENDGRVIADFETRRRQVIEGARDAAAELGGEAVLEDAVVDEVTALVEWPVPVTGRFPERFLALPSEVLVSTLQDHQRYFPVRKGDELLAAFVATSNIDSREPAEVRRGNERVVLPRLADAAFFVEQDKRTPLAERVDALDRVVYQKGLGSLRDKSLRVETLAAELAAVTDAAEEVVRRAARLARTDLLTEMVGEFPELQGRIGYYYALADGEPEAVATAIEEQYLPRQAGDRLPATAAGRALALAERLDTLAGVFALGKKPGGNKDPFGLRRQALGLVRIVVESGIDLDLPAWLRRAAELQPGISDAAPADEIAEQLNEFVLERMRAWYLDGQAPGFARGDVSAEMFSAVLARAPASPLDFHARLVAVQRFMRDAAAPSLAAANKRIANILKQAEANDARNAIDPGRFTDAAEGRLHAAVAGMLDAHAKDLRARDYAQVLERLSALREPVDAYFDEVMVMAEEPGQRANRLAQLGQLRELFLDVADISHISNV